MTETLHISNLDFEVRRSHRRKTLGLTVDRAGELVVHAPATADEAELRQWVTRKLLWVHQKLAQKQEMNATKRTPEFVSGESFYYLGRTFRLKLVVNADKPLRFNGEWFHLRKRDCADAAAHFRQWYLDTGSEWLTKRAEAWQSRVGAKPARLNVGDLGYRWGSCGKNRVVYFNWRLLQLPVRLVDYVVVHELVHLHEHSHNPEFWEILDRVLPDWRERKKVMESSGQAYVTFGIGTVGEAK